MTADRLTGDCEIDCQLARPTHRGEGGMKISLAERLSDARITQLESALADAIEGLDEMLPYMDDYFVKMWKLDGYAVRAKIALSFPPPDPSQAHVLRHVEHGVVLWSAHWLRDGYGGHAYFYRNDDLHHALESVGAFVIRNAGG